MSNNECSAPIIDVRNLNKSFGKIHAVSDLTLKINSATIFGFLGANGSGKSTSLRLLCGLLLPNSGEGMCLNYNLFTQTKLIQEKIGYMPQYFCLYRNLTVYENLDFMARIYKLKQRKKKIAEIIELFLLKQNQHQISGTLSGGWQQRVALAVALLHEPKLLLLDEPTSGIDPQSRILIWEHIQELVRTGATVLLSTHYMDEAERCHQLAYMSNGKILMHGSSSDIIQATGLHTWRMTGKNLPQLKNLLKPYLKYLQVIEKGNEIRISALQPDALEKIDSSILMNYESQAVQTNLEDVFIFKIQHEGKNHED